MSWLIRQHPPCRCPQRPSEATRGDVWQCDTCGRAVKRDGYGNWVYLSRRRTERIVRRLEREAGAV